MSNEVSVKYTVVKGLDVAAAMKASAGATDAQRKMERLNGSVWEQTVAAVMEEAESRQTVFVKDTTKEGIQAIGETCKDLMEQYMYSQGVVIPETGKNRKGETFVIMNKKTNKPSFSQWAETRRIWAYIGDIAKIIAHNQEGHLYPEKFKVGARIDCLKLCKSQTNAMDNVKRLVKDLQGFLDVVDSKDGLDAQTHVDSLSVPSVPALEEATGIIRKLDAICGSVEGAEKDQLKQMLLGMATKHFA